MARSNTKNNKRLSQIVSWTITSVLAMIIIGVLFLKFTPGFGFYFVKSGSMSPVFNAGDIVITGPADQIKTGQVITFIHEGKLITHRVTGIEGDQIQTKGDANEDADPFITPVSQVQGSYLFRIPGLGYFQNLLHTKMGWFLIVILPTFLLLIWIVVELFREILKTPAPKTASARAGSGSVFIAPAKKEQQPMTRSDSKINKIQKKRVASTGLPSKEVVENIRKQLNENFKDIYQGIEINK